MIEGHLPSAFENTHSKSFMGYIVFKLIIFLDLLEFCAKTINLTILELLLIIGKYTVQFLILLMWPIGYTVKCIIMRYDKHISDKTYVLICDDGIKKIIGKDTKETVMLTGIEYAVLLQMRRISKHTSVDPAFRIRVVSPSGDSWRIDGMF